MDYPYLNQATAFDTTTCSLSTGLSSCQLSACSYPDPFSTSCSMSQVQAAAAAQHYRSYGAAASGHHALTTSSRHFPGGHAVTPNSGGNSVCGPMSIGGSRPRSSLESHHHYSHHVVPSSAPHQVPSLYTTTHPHDGILTEKTETEKNTNNLYKRTT